MTRKLKDPCTCAATPAVTGAIFTWHPCPQHRVFAVRAHDGRCACTKYPANLTSTALDDDGWWHTADKCFRGPA